MYILMYICMSHSMSWKYQSELSLYRTYLISVTKGVKTIDRSVKMRFFFLKGSVY